MNRTAVAVDAVYDNLAFIKKSHDRLGLGTVHLIYNSVRWTRHCQGFQMLHVFLFC